MARRFFSRCGVLTVLLLFTAVILMPQQVNATPTVTCNSPMTVVAGVGGNHTVTAVAESGCDPIIAFSPGPLPAGITFGSITPPLNTSPSVSATVTVASTVSPGTYWITITAQDND